MEVGIDSLICLLLKWVRMRMEFDRVSYIRECGMEIPARERWEWIWAMKMKSELIFILLLKIKNC